ncbi:MAG: nucleotidyltransferase family protein [Imperialibacter sp.]|uniref:nucleotidyltransferase family protein n=1 Tax=Imperialibacter sp. TaxID=2038411 RepID=UPI0030D89232
MIATENSLNWEVITANQKRIIKEITGKYNPTLLGIFGSYARNEQIPKSDIDILIDFDKTVDLLQLIGLEQELSEVLGVKVDLITVKSLNEKLKPYIEQDLIRIL